jgi:hypothetical protein
MASKKKRNRPRPPSASRPAGTGPARTAPAAKSAGPRPGAAKPAPKDRSGPSRAERLAAAEAARRRKASRNRALIGAGLVAVLVLLVVTVSNSRRSNDRVVADLESSGACKYDTKSDTDSGAGNNHVSGDIAYQVDPPAGGNHNPTAAGPGIFTLETKPPDGQIVHALEHGYVAIWYRPDLDPAALDQLKTLANKYDRDVLLVPRPSLTEPVAATAWHHRLLCSRPDVTALERFVTAYRNKGPEKVPH